MVWILLFLQIAIETNRSEKDGTVLDHLERGKSNNDGFAIRSSQARFIHPCTPNSA